MPKPKPTAADCETARTGLEQRLKSIGFDAEVLRMLRVGGGSRPHVAVARLDGKSCVIKDHAGCDPWFARLLGPMLARREMRALDRLEPVDGVPRLLHRFDSRAFAMGLLDATPYRCASHTDNEWSLFFARMEELVATMHNMGIAHCDLRSPDNTLITSNLKPAVVDFVACYSRGAGWNPWSRWVFARLCKVDISAIDKQKRTVARGLVKDVDGQQAINREGLIDTAARNFGVLVRNVARLLFTKKRSG